MIGSISHLGQRGLESYTTDLGRVILSLGAKVGGGVEVIPHVLVPLGGIESSAMIRGLLDLDAWTLAWGFGCRRPGMPSGMFFNATVSFILQLQCIFTNGYVLF
jgi:hypothetical protein